MVPEGLVGCRGCCVDNYYFGLRPKLENKSANSGTWTRHALLGELLIQSRYTRDTLTDGYNFQLAGLHVASDHPPPAIPNIIHTYSVGVLDLPIVFDQHLSLLYSLIPPPTCHISPSLHAFCYFGFAFIFSAYLDSIIPYDLCFMLSADLSPLDTPFKQTVVTRR